MLARTLLLALAILTPHALSQDKDKDKVKDKDKPAKAEAFVFPLKVGTVWTYRVAENIYFLKVAKLETVGKQECARLEMQMNGKDVSFEHLAAGRVGKDQDQEGTPAILRYSFEGKEATPAIPVLLLPADKKAWKVKCKLADKDLEGTFIKSEEDVKVPAGTYKKAVKVTAKNLKVNGVDLSISYWFVSGVGMVKQEAEMAGSKVVIELERIELPK